jgi:hypothetical protein
MTDEASPIAFTALKPGTPVQSSDGQQFGTVEAVLQVEEVDVFDGIVVRTADGTRFVDADQVDSIFTSYVRTTLSTDEAANLPFAGPVTRLRRRPNGRRRRLPERPIRTNVRSRQVEERAIGAPEERPIPQTVCTAAQAPPPHALVAYAHIRISRTACAPATRFCRT